MLFYVGAERWLPNFLTYWLEGYSAWHWDEEVIGFGKDVKAEG